MGLKIKKREGKGRQVCKQGVCGWKEEEEKREGVFGWVFGI